MFNFNTVIMDFKSATKLLGKLVLCLLAIFVALLTTNLSISEGGIYILAGILNGAAWVCALVWFFKNYIKPKTDADKNKK